MARTQAQREAVYDEAIAAIGDGAAHVSTWAPDEDVETIVAEAVSYLGSHSINAGTGQSVQPSGWWALTLQGG